MKGLKGQSGKGHVREPSRGRRGPGLRAYAGDSESVAAESSASFASFKKRVQLPFEHEGARHQSAVLLFRGIDHPLTCMVNFLDFLFYEIN